MILLIVVLPLIMNDWVEFISRWIDFFLSHYFREVETRIDGMNCKNVDKDTERRNY